MDEHRPAAAAVGDVAGSRQVAVLRSVSEAEPPDLLPYRELGLRVLRRTRPNCSDVARSVSKRSRRRRSAPRRFRFAATCFSTPHAFEVWNLRLVLSSRSPGTSTARGNHREVHKHEFAESPLPLPVP